MNYFGDTSKMNMFQNRMNDNLGIILKDSEFFNPLKINKIEKKRDSKHDLKLILRHLSSDSIEQNHVINDINMAKYMSHDQ